MMKRKTMLLAAAALSVVAFAALPSIASAFTTTPAVSLPSYPTAFSGTSNETGVLYGGTKYECKAEGGVPARTIAGKFDDAHTGSVKFIFHNCREKALNTKCTTAGLAAGSVETTTLPFHTVYLKGNTPHDRPGVLITPNAGHFATFSCAGGLVKVVVTGTGVLGTVTAPGIGEKSGSFTVKVKATEAGQEHAETTEGEKFGVFSSVNGGEPHQVFQDVGSTTSTFAGGAEATTTTETP